MGAQGSLPTESTCVWLIWRGFMTMSNGESCCCEPSGPCTTKVRAVSVSLALASPRDVPYNWFCLWCSWTGSQGTARGRRLPPLGPRELCLCSLQIMWLWQLHHTVSSSTYCGSMESSVSQNLQVSKSPKPRINLNTSECEVWSNSLIYCKCHRTVSSQKKIISYHVPSLVHPPNHNYTCALVSHTDTFSDTGIHNYRHLGCTVLWSVRITLHTLFLLNVHVRHCRNLLSQKHYIWGDSRCITKLLLMGGFIQHFKFAPMI